MNRHEVMSFSPPTPDNPEPSPENDVAVAIPVMTTPEEVVSSLVVLEC